MAAPSATSGASAVEPMVVAAAISRGYITLDQVEQAKRARDALLAQGRPTDLLPIIAARFLNPEQREAMRKVYFDALSGTGVAKTEADAESTQLLDPPSLIGVGHGGQSRPSVIASGLIAPGTVAPTTAEADDEPTKRLDGPPVILTPPSIGTATAPGSMAWKPQATSPGKPAPAFGESPVSADSLGPRPAERTRAETPRPPETKELDPKARLGNTVASSAPNAPAESIEGYEVQRELGRGGMGVVYAAKRLATGETVALKVLLSGKGASDEDVKRFQIEAKAAQRLDHPNTVRVIDSGKDPKGHWFMAMELVDGEALEARVRRDGPLEEREAARVIAAVARALEAAHDLRILHRDLKPHNIMMMSDGTPKLGDFGLAKVAGDNQKSLTTTGHGLMGTPGYMSPEQAGGERKRIDARSDVYGLGATLYHLIVGVVPFDGDTLANVVVAVLQRPPVKPTQRRPGLSKAIETICLKCMEKEPDDRYQTMAELADDLERLLADRSIVARPPSAVKKASRWANQNQTVTLVVLGVVALIALGALAAWRVITVKQREAEQARLDADLARIAQEKADLEARAERDRLEREKREAAAKAERDKAEAEERSEREKRQIVADAEAKARELAAERARVDAEAEARREREALAQREREAQASAQAQREREAQAQRPDDPAQPPQTAPQTAVDREAAERERAAAERAAVERLAARDPEIAARIATLSRGTPWEGFEPPPIGRQVLPVWLERFAAPTPPGALHLARSVEAALAEVAARKVPLVIVALGAPDEPPDQLVAMYPALDTAAVVLASQKLKKDEGGSKQREAYQRFVEVHGVGATCALHRAISCAVHHAVRDALDDGALGVLDKRAFDCDAPENWRILVFAPDGAGVKLMGHAYDSHAFPGLPGRAIAQRDIAPGTLGPLLASRPAGRHADLLAVADAEVAVGPADLTRVYRAARSLAQVPELQAWASEVLALAKARAHALGAWTQTLRDKTERARRLRADLDERELAEEFDKGKAARR